MQVCEISGIGSEEEGSLCDAVGQELWLEEWEYPPIGIYFTNDPSAGHAMFALGYQECGKDGEPKVVLVERKWNFGIVEFTPNFETFIHSPRHGDEFLDN